MAITLAFSMKQLGVLLHSLDGMLVYHRVTPSIKFAGIHLYILVERGTVRLKCLAQEHNTMSPARALPEILCLRSSALTIKTLHLKTVYIQHHN